MELESHVNNRKETKATNVLPRNGFSGMFGPCTVQGEGRWSHLEQVDTFEIGHGAFHATQIAVLVQSLQYNLRTP